MKTHRRKFIQSLLTAPALLGSGLLLNPVTGHASAPGKGGKLRTSLNAFSFNGPLLTDKTMTLDDVMDFCAQTGFDAIDITGYYFPGYPKVPDDAYIYHLKNKAFRLGLDISGTGVRNDFTDPDKQKRQEHVKLTKNWVEVAAKLGAPVLRIFAGNQNPPKGFTRAQTLEWLIADVKECVEYGKKFGVIVAIQNHNDFIQTADQAIEIVKAIDSEWSGLILDTGSYRVGDPYQEIAKTAGIAANWQVKEYIFVDGKEVETDLPKLIAIIRESGYSGYLPIETLGSGDPKVKVKVLYEKLVKALS